MNYRKDIQGTVGKLIGKKFKTNYKCGAKPFHGRAYRILHDYIYTISKYEDMLLELGVIN